MVVQILTVMVPIFFIMHFPPTPDVPPVLQGKAAVMVLGCYNGLEADGEAAFQPMRTLGTPLLDTFARIPYSQIATISNEFHKRRETHEY